MSHPHPEMVQDIMEQQSDKEEIDVLLSSAYFIDQQQTTKQISLKVSLYTLNRLKIRAKQEGLPYQTLINSVLHKYIL